MKGCGIPGPAGDDDMFLLEEKAKSDSSTFRSTSRLNSSSSGCKDANKLPFSGKRGSVEGSEFEVLQISEGLLGELLLTVKNGTLVTQISATSRAKAMFTSVLPGDTLCLDKIHVITSHHNKPLSLVCVDCDGNTQSIKVEIASMPVSKGTFIGTSRSQDPKDPNKCRDSESSKIASEQKRSPSQANHEKDEVDDLLEGVMF